MSISLPMFGKFSATNVLNMLSVPLSFFSPSGIPKMQISFHVSHNPYRLSYLFFSFCSSDWIILFFPLSIQFIGVTLFNKSIRVSSAQFYNTLSVHCTVCSPPPVKSRCITIYPPIPSSICLHSPSPLKSPHYCPVVRVHEFCHFIFIFA